MSHFVVFIFVQIKISHVIFQRDLHLIIKQHACNYIYGEHSLFFRTGALHYTHIISQM